LSDVVGDLDGERVREWDVFVGVVHDDGRGDV
jgi:hypothetical protein